MPGGDVLFAGTRDIPNQLPDCPGEYPGKTKYHASFGRFDGANGTMEWHDYYKSPSKCADFGRDIVGISDGRVYAIDYVWLGGMNAASAAWVVQYAEDGTILTEAVIGGGLMDVKDATVGANDRVFVAGHLWEEGFITELNLATGGSLAKWQGYWDIDLHVIDAIAAFENGEFAILASQLNLARINLNQQSLWSVDGSNGYWEARIDIGGPSETLAVHREPDVVEIFDADGNAQWETPGTWARVDPNGDVYVVVDDELQKRAGADGGLLCSTVLPMDGLSLAVDEEGFPIVLDYDAITKYTP